MGLVAQGTSSKGWELEVWIMLGGGCGGGYMLELIEGRIYKLHIINGLKYEGLKLVYLMQWVW